MWGSIVFIFFFKQKTAYEMCGRDWSSDVCSSDLGERAAWREGGMEREEEGGSEKMTGSKEEISEGPSEGGRRRKSSINLK